MGRKWTKMAENVPQNGRQWPKMGENWPKIAKNGKKWAKLAKNRRKWTEKGRRKWTKMAKNGQPDDSPNARLVGEILSPRPVVHESQRY